MAGKKKIGTRLQVLGGVDFLDVLTGNVVGSLQSTEAKSEFGTSVSFHENTKTLFVGAPGANRTAIFLHTEVAAGRVRGGCKEGAAKQLSDRMASRGEHYQEKDSLKDRLI